MALGPPVSPPCRRAAGEPATAARSVCRGGRSLPAQRKGRPGVTGAAPRPREGSGPPLAPATARAGPRGGREGPGRAAGLPPPGGREGRGGRGDWRARRPPRQSAALFRVTGRGGGVRPPGPPAANGQGGGAGAPAAARLARPIGPARGHSGGGRSSLAVGAGGAVRQSARPASSAARLALAAVSRAAPLPQWPPRPSVKRFVPPSSSSRRRR